VEAGEGPLIVLLHGFPDFWFGWRHQIPALAAAGFRVVAPDMRGYNLSAKPPGVRAYRLELLADDVAGLIRHLGVARAVVVGHDWGGVIAAYLATRWPEVVDGLVMMNAPHPAAFWRELRTPSQLRRSWYVLFFQLPWLPEATIRARDFRFIRRLFRTDPARPGAFSDDDIERYVEAAAQPGALTAMVNYYRAALRRSPGRLLRQVRRIIDVPTLVIWGERDRYLGPRMTRGLERWMPKARIERIADASHWVQHDVPERVNDLIREFVGTRDAGPVRSRLIADRPTAKGKS
jgi:pimeloyl-ACP methyl ester carboxylesterase